MLVRVQQAEYQEDKRGTGRVVQYELDKKNIRICQTGKGDNGTHQEIAASQALPEVY